jgi:hypothetical protein
MSNLPKRLSNLPKRQWSNLMLAHTEASIAANPMILSIESAFPKCGAEIIEVGELLLNLVESSGGFIESSIVHEDPYQDRQKRDTSG